MSYLMGLLALVGVLLVIAAPLVLATLGMLAMSVAFGFEWVGPIIFVVLAVGIAWHVVRIVVFRRNPRG